MKRFWTVLFVSILCVAVAAPSVLAADKKPEKKAEPKVEKPKPPAEAPKAAQVTHGELAQLLIQVLGLGRFLPASPSNKQCYEVLLSNAISPLGGWEEGKIVTRADLARVIVQGMKRQNEVKNPDNPESWINFLKGIGVPIETVGESVTYLEPLAEPVAPNVVSARTDPLSKRHMFNPLDETQYGVDMEYVMRILSRVEFEAPEFQPRPVTPD